MQQKRKVIFRTTHTKTRSRERKADEKGTKKKANLQGEKHTIKSQGSRGAKGALTRMCTPTFQWTVSHGEMAHFPEPCLHLDLIKYCLFMVVSVRFTLISVGK